MQEVENFIITIVNSSNQSIILQGANPTDFGLTSVSGLEASGYTQSINTNGNFPGGTLTSTSVSPRTIGLNFVIMKNEREQSNRLLLESFLDPFDDYDVIVSRLDTTRHIKCKLSKFSVKQSYLQARQYVTLSMIAPNPFFLDMSDYGQNIANITRMFAPPFLMAESGQVMGIIKSSELTTITNNGDMSVGLTARFVCNDTVENIKIFNARDESEFVRVIDTFQNGDIITISMMDGNKSIKKTNASGTVNIINKLDRSSNFFKIKQGDTLISYDADLNKNSLEVRIYYTPLYFGV